MARIVCTWELGAHLGHITRFAGLAEALHQQGHQLDFIFRELHGVNTIFGATPPHRFFQAPLARNNVASSRNPLSYSEILLCNGYFDSDSLRYLIKAWKALFDLIQPDLLLCDYSPTALLASRDMGIPQVELGTGFFVHPPVSPMPCMISGGRIPLAQRQQTDQQLVDNINRALATENISPLKQVCDIFSGAHQWLASYPELDHCPDRNKGDYVGILTNPNTGAPPQWSQQNSTRLFAYLKPTYPALPEFLATLAQSHIEARLYIPNIPKALVAQYQSKHLHFSDRPYDMDSALAGCDIAVCHGSHNTVAHALLRGKPLLLIPEYIEQLDLAKCAQRYGYGICTDPKGQGPLIKKALHRLITNPDYQQNCQGFASRYRHRDIRQCIERVAERCIALL